MKNLISQFYGQRSVFGIRFGKLFYFCFCRETFRRGMSKHSCLSIAQALVGVERAGGW